MESRYPVQFQLSSPPPTEDDVRASERRLGVLFPDDYRSFLLSVNGGAPSPERVKIPGTDHAIRVDFLYAVKGERQRGDLEYEQDAMQSRTDHTIPDGFIVIGRDPGGQPFFISTKGNAAGNVYFFDSQAFFDPARSQRKLYKVADTFTELIDAMAQEA